MRISLKDEKFFRTMIGVFADKGNIEFDIRPEEITASSCGQSNFYLVINNDVFTADGECLSFVVKAQHLLEGINALGRYDLVIEDDLKLLDGGNTIFIPFLPAPKSEYEEPDTPVAKLVVSPELLEAFGMLKGVVTYEIEGNKLFIRKAGSDVLEEIEFLTGGFIIAGDLQFKCNNRWTDVLAGIKSYVDSIMLTFGANTLCIQFLFKKYSRSYLELQVWRSLGD
ncbi:uncharacterized protein Eint_071250 [Encephalitozoon intestinalis ATCC 50506]|uniref:Proliferating cell nuclear antigen n=1 Tax=Encephalitozoon intestinalis (strain ATCC 50506) TaxID=876142 RepID=E0S853_ENCIT|nr:uncharacterized protein Eint_071250 [Encephalitozoon intestinalis ATCC 50506]ADM11888.1 hypothetical protein Eint_071250 [Encephalitozoon intestinalis ATCC 50506]UTX45644.1 DNA repair protein Rad1 [Encephalitozoon intestinalis]